VGYFGSSTWVVGEQVKLRFQYRKRGFVWWIHSKVGFLLCSECGFRAWEGQTVGKGRLLYVFGLQNNVTGLNYSTSPTYLQLSYVRSGVDSVLNKQIIKFTKRNNPLQLDLSMRIYRLGCITYLIQISTGISINSIRGRSTRSERTGSGKLCYNFNPPAAQLW
jgi:hypothetical protein